MRDRNSAGSPAAYAPRVSRRTSTQAVLVIALALIGATATACTGEASSPHPQAATASATRSAPAGATSDGSTGSPAVAGSTGTPATGSTASVSNCLASPHGIDWLAVKRTRVVTDARLLSIDRTDKRVLTPVAGLNKTITPTVVGLDGSVVSPQAVLRVFQQKVPVAARPGPVVEPPSSWFGEDLAPGYYVTFTGADQVQALFETSCGGHEVHGSLSSWTARAAGILECKVNPPMGSTAARVQDYCPHSP